MPRRIKIRQEDLEEYGYTSGCNGRKAKVYNREARPHSDACRQRIQKLLQGSERMNKVQKKQDEFSEKVATKVGDREEQQKKRSNEDAADESEEKKRSQRKRPQEASSQRKKGKEAAKSKREQSVKERGPPFLTW